MPPVAQGRWRVHLSQESTEPAPLASLKTTSPQPLFSATVRVRFSHESSYATQVNCVAAIVTLACSFTNEVLTDLGWNYMRNLNRPKSSVYLAFLATLLLDPAILPSFLLWPWYLSTSSLWQIEEINLLESFFFVGFLFVFQQQRAAV